MKIAILASGGLGFKCLQFLNERYDIVCVFTDSASNSIINWAQENDKPVFKGNPRNGRCRDFFIKYDIDVVFSINYLFIIEKEMISWPKRYAFNIHGSLLPKYRGRTPHVWAIINNEKQTGVTVHFINEGCDTGDIVFQRSFEINTDMTGADILKRFEILYPDMISTVLEKVSRNSIVPIKQDEIKATYFGKRTPGDGAIDWNWQKERIQNWVRAQTFPYPGAFSSYDGMKITIMSVLPDDTGFDWNDPNGKIIAIKNSSPVVKTPNGALCLNNIVNENPLEYKIGNLFI